MTGRLDVWIPAAGGALVTSPSPQRGLHNVEILLPGIAPVSIAVEL